MTSVSAGPRPILFFLAAATAFAQPVPFHHRGGTNFGIWSAESAVTPGAWAPGTPVAFRTVLTVADSHVTMLAKTGINPDGFVLLATAERTFDSSGRLRLPNDERMSTLLTPTGLPIEGGISGAVTDRFGYPFRTPVDLLFTVPFREATGSGGLRRVTFETSFRVPDDVPPGVYRLRFDYGLTAQGSFYSLNGEPFARRSLRNAVSHHYSPPIRVSGRNTEGARVDSSALPLRIPWVLLDGYNSNGYMGAVAAEDQRWFNISGRNLIQDDIILPRFGDRQQPLRYSLEPRFPADSIDPHNNIPWDFSAGELSLRITAPDGTLTDLGTAPFVAGADLRPTTRNPRFTHWLPPQYGKYTVRARGWSRDIWGNKYAGGGTYTFWIARRMTMATATFQGMPYSVGTRYGRDITFAPAVPADVVITATLFVNSNAGDRRSVTSTGRASGGGVFGAAQGMRPLPLDAPGEYGAHILARYLDKHGHLWVCSMRHAGVVYPADSPIAAHGKKMYLKGAFLDRGETRTEGVNDEDYSPKPTTAENGYLNFPWFAGDVLLIASDQNRANSIVPVLTVSREGTADSYDPRLGAVEATNVRLVTSNHLSPHLFPEFITEWGYYYAAAPRPGFMGRFLVGEDGVRESYWPTSPNSFGEQAGASSNGDLPGDIYRLIGGVVVRRPGVAAAYAGYQASAFLLPKNTRNNRVVRPGSEDLIGPDGSKARAWLAGLRPGTLFETGSSFRPAVQIDPILPVNVVFTLQYPDGRKRIARGAGDRLGSFVGPETWTLDIPGVYRFRITGEWEGFQARMPGLAADGGVFYVSNRDRPAGVPELNLKLPPESTFDVETGAAITGRSTAGTVHYAAVIPGAVIQQGELPVRNGLFTYHFDPAAVSRKFPTYDTFNKAAFWPELKRTVQVSFFAEEVAADGTKYPSFVRLIIRGDRILYTR